MVRTHGRAVFGRLALDRTAFDRLTLDRTGFGRLTLLAGHTI